MPDAVVEASIGMAALEYFTPTLDGPASVKAAHCELPAEDMEVTAEDGGIGGEPKHREDGGIAEDMEVTAEDGGIDMDVDSQRASADEVPGSAASVAGGRGERRAACSAHAALESISQTDSSAARATP